MKSQIIHRYTGAVIAESDTLSTRELTLQNKDRLQCAKFNAVDFFLKGQMPSTYAEHVKIVTASPPADLTGIDLSGCDLREADFSHCILSGANFKSANLYKAGFREACVTDAEFFACDLSRSGCVQANFSGSNFGYANLRYTIFRECDLTRVEMNGADLRSTDFSDSVGIQTARGWLEQFERDELGVIVYRRTGYGKAFETPSTRWKIEPGAFITDTPNPTLGHGCGVAFGTYDLCVGILHDMDLWRCRIRWLDLADVYRVSLTGRENILGVSEGRCGRLELLEIVKKAEPFRRTSYLSGVVRVF